MCLCHYSCPTACVCQSIYLSICLSVCLSSYTFMSILLLWGFLETSGSSKRGGTLEGYPFGRPRIVQFIFYLFLNVIYSHLSNKFSIYITGSALLFCNVLPNGDPDKRIAHRECTMDEGLRKYIVNASISGTNMIKF